MPAFFWRTVHAVVNPARYGPDRSLGPWESPLKNAGILLGLVGIGILPLLFPLGLALIAAGMEFLWLASPGLV
jgi:hypothetical protein